MVNVRKRGKVYEYRFEIASSNNKRRWLSKSGFRTKLEAGEAGIQAYNEYLNAGIPFKWEFEIEDESIAKFVKSYVVKDENTNGKVGASVYTNYVFKGLKEGKTKITFKFVSITDEKVEKEETHTVKVDRNKNISLVVMDE